MQRSTSSVGGGSTLRIMHVLNFEGLAASTVLKAQAATNLNEVKSVDFNELHRLVEHARVNVNSLLNTTSGTKSDLQNYSNFGTELSAIQAEIAACAAKSAELKKKLEEQDQAIKTASENYEKNKKTAQAKNDLLRALTPYLDLLVAQKKTPEKKTLDDVDNIRAVVHKIKTDLTNLLLKTGVAVKAVGGTPAVSLEELQGKSGMRLQRRT